jgi:TrmH family RNA methyltransferase
MQAITSVHNPVIQAAKALQTKRGRDESGLFLCEGEHMVAEAVMNPPGDVRILFVEENQATKYAALPAAAPQAAVYAVSAQVLKAVSQVMTPQGVVAVVKKPETAGLARLGKHVALLENVQDPGNVGTMFRTADAAGFAACVLTPGCADPFSAKALRATMGSVFRVPCAEAESAAKAAREMKEAGYAVIATTLDGEDFYERAPLPEKVCLMIGNEGAGLTNEAIKEATHRYRLPMRGGAESLNAAVAAAIFMFEIAFRG